MRKGLCESALNASMTYVARQNLNAHILLILSSNLLQSYLLAACIGQMEIACVRNASDLSPQTPISLMVVGCKTAGLCLGSAPIKVRRDYAACCTLATIGAGRALSVKKLASRHNLAANRTQSPPTAIGLRLQPPDERISALRNEESWRDSPRLALKYRASCARGGHA